MIILPKRLQIWCNAYQITNGIFPQNSNKNFLQSVWKHKRVILTHDWPDDFVETNAYGQQFVI